MNHIDCLYQPEMHVGYYFGMVETSAKFYPLLTILASSEAGDGWDTLMV